jgi:hypothetical protein
VKETIDRIVRANPVPEVALADDDFVDSAVLLSAIVSRRDAMTHTPTNEQEEVTVVQTPWYRRPALVALLAAMTTVVVVGATTLLLGGGGDAPIDTASGTTMPPATEAAPTTMETEQPTTSTAVAREWNPILATTEAKQAPRAATCPAGSDPNSLGPVAQNRPQLGGYTSNQSAAFDRHAGRVIHIDDTGETWAFDVCTNTWEQLDPEVDTRGLTFEASPSGGQLVYDIDSDATLLIRDGVVLVYDAAANAWVAQQAPTKTYGIHNPGLGAIYDPISGLVVVQTAEHGIVAYDVDTNAWTEIGTLAGDYPDYLVGYSATADRLYFLGFQDDGTAVDPRTGRTEPLPGPVEGVAGGFGAFEYATSTETAYVFGNGVCRLDPTSLDWTCTGKADIPRFVQNFESMVGDPINNRLILFHGSCCGLYPTMHDDIFALDSETGTWSVLLEEANQRLHE